MSVLDHFQDWIIKEEDYKLAGDKPVGEGSFGKVWRAAMVADSPKGRWKKDEFAAVKIMEPDSTVSDFKLARELLIPCACKIPWLVPFFGYVPANDKHGAILVTKYMCNSTLEKIMEQRRPNPKKRIIGWSDQKFATIMYTVAKTMQFMHAQGFMHCDLKPENIFLGPKNTAMIGGFRTAVLGSEGEYDRKLGIGYPLFMAPEAQGSSYTNKVDVYSFGMTLYAYWVQKEGFIFDDDTPVTTVQVLFLKINAGVRYKNTGIPEPYWGLINRCWDHDPDARPTFAEICDMMETDPGFTLGKAAVARKCTEEMLDIKKKTDGAKHEEFQKVIMQMREASAAATYTSLLSG